MGRLRRSFGKMAGKAGWLAMVGIIVFSGTVLAVDFDFGDTGPFYGGFSDDDSVDISGNDVNVIGDLSPTPSDVHGGASWDDGGLGDGGSDVYDNSVTIGGSGIVDGSVMGGGSWTTSTGVIGSAYRNTVTVESGGQVYVDVYGGASDGNVSNNTVTLDGLFEIGRNVGGGNVTTNTGSLSIDSEAVNNAVFITGSGGKIDFDVYGAIINDAGGVGNTGAVSQNTVDINSNVSILGNVIGGLTNADGIVSDNTVTINEASITGYIAGGQIINGGLGNNVTGNSVVIESGTMSGTVFGGVTDGTGDATFNTVTINGGTFGAIDIVGGQSTGGAATNNTINIARGVTATTLASVSLYGGRAGTLADNTLFFGAGVLEGTQVADIQNFDFATIEEISANVAHNDIMIRNTAGDFTNTTVSVLGINAGSSLGTGDTVVLFENNGAGTFANENATASVHKGMAEVYQATYEVQGTGIIMTLGARSANAAARFLSVGQLSAVAFADRGGDLITDSAFAAATAAFDVNCVDPCDSKFTTFAAVGGTFGKQDYGTHSVDIQGVNFMVGLGYRSYISPTSPSWMLGTFFEGGYGKYKDSPRAKGDMHYFGGGLMGRIDSGFGLYAEASGRVGQLTNDFSSNAVAGGVTAKYNDLHSTYYGAHAGVGYIATAGSAKIDFSAKYLWTHSNSKSVAVLDENVDFDKINSQRFRGGARFSYDIGNCVTPYAGIAYEYQFDGKAKTTVSGMRVGDNRQKGSSGVADAGIRFRAASNRVSMDIGGYAAFGKREDYGVRAFLGLDF